MDVIQRDVILEAFSHQLDAGLLVLVVHNGEVDHSLRTLHRFGLEMYIELG